LYTNFYKAFGKWPRRRLGWLPAYVTRWPGTGPVTVLVNVALTEANNVMELSRLMPIN
jgi:hypothetical protein